MLARLCFPEGPVIVIKMSGTPETLLVKAMVPFANAASGRPEGAMVTLRDSTTSAYSSLLVCRTFALRHGSAGVVAAIKDGALELEKLVAKLGFLEATRQYGRGQPASRSTGPDVPGKADAAEQFPHEALDFNQISQRIWLCRVDDAGITHLGKKLSDDIVAILDPTCAQRCAEKLLEGIDDPVDELEYQERLDL